MGIINRKMLRRTQWAIPRYAKAAKRSIFCHSQRIASIPRRPNPYVIPERI
jgi:hypothetical protein